MHDSCLIPARATLLKVRSLLGFGRPIVVAVALVAVVVPIAVAVALVVAAVLLLQMALNFQKGDASLAPFARSFVVVVVDDIRS